MADLDLKLSDEEQKDVDSRPDGEVEVAVGEGKKWDVATFFTSVAASSKRPRLDETDKFRTQLSQDVANIPVTSDGIVKYWTDSSEDVVRELLSRAGVLHLYPELVAVFAEALDAYVEEPADWLRHEHVRRTSAQEAGLEEVPEEAA